MSTFEVKIRKLTDVQDHADRLSVASVGGFRVVTQRGRFKDGDLAVYVPEAAVVPDEVLKASGFWFDCRKCEGSGSVELDLGEHDLAGDKPETVTCKTCKGAGSYGGLAGSAGNRVKPIKLQGIVSEGILLGLDVLDGYCEDCPAGEPCKHRDYWATEGVDVGEVLGVEKYVVPIPTQLSGKYYPLSGTIKANSAPENVKKVGAVFEPGEVVVFSEKVHGSSAQSGIKDGEYFVTSKGMGAKGLVLEDEKDEQGRSTNFYHRSLNTVGGENTLRRISEEYGGGGDVYLYGEAWPCQNMRYNLNEGGEARFAAFDIRIGGHFVSHEKFVEITSSLNIPTVPILYVGPYSDEELARHTEGREQVSGKEVHTREGIVAKAVDESRDARGNRRIIKSISEKYAVMKNKTEFN